MAALLNLIGLACGIGSLVCFILVLVQMFQQDHVGLAIVCLVLSLLCGIGGLVAFIFGWLNAQEWGIQPIMVWWTGFFLGGIIISMLTIAAGMSTALLG